MRKRVFIGGFVVVYLMFIYAIFNRNNILGDILSPILMLIFTAYIFHGFVLKQDNFVYKCFGWFYTLGFFAWFFCDAWWGIQTLILHINPEENFITLYGYSLTNLFFFLALLFSGYEDLKKINKIQAFLDMILVLIYVEVLLWLFVFEESMERLLLLASDPILFVSVIIDVAIYVWINVWAFSTRLIKPPFHHRIIVTGGLVYVVTDLVYYYYYFYSDYEPNSLIDGAYFLAFSIFAISIYSKKKVQTKELQNQQKEEHYKGFRLELLIMFAPLVVIFFKPEAIQYFILLVVSLLVYYILMNYTQQSIFRERLLELEKKNVQELEKKVEERTEEIIKILNTDFISGLYNRRYFEAKLSETLNNLDRNERVSILYIDQNKSKAIRYLYGKETFEKLIKNISEMLKELVSVSRGLLASYGDDIFVVMLKGYDADAVAGSIAEKIVKRCNKLIFIENHAIRVTINIGISSYPKDTSSGDDLIKNAEVAMTQAREKGFNQIQFYNDKIGNLTFNRHKIELKLKKVKFDKEFRLYYQPQVYCQNGALCGVETLVRWYDREENIIPPLDFIPVAEETGLIIPLGYWIIENAVKQAAFWKIKRGQDLKIAVNISSKQLVEIDFVKKVDNILKMYDVKHELFEIEITESQQIENSIYIKEKLNELKSLGISIAIDDFGIGYSSLYYIKDLPVDRVKIAKEIVDSIENDMNSHAIIKMVIYIAKIKGIKVIAEGVETKEQWECLKELGCDEIQGYYFAKPMPADEIEKYWIT